MNVIDKATFIMCIKNAELRMLSDIEYWDTDEVFVQKTLTYIAGIHDMAIAAINELEGEVK